jgi:PIN domain nuclease of toxin-antitoxin system
VKVLLDTCTFLWLAQDETQISDAARRAIDSAGPQVFLSVVSVWEIATKYESGKLDLAEPPARYVPRLRERYRLMPLPLTEADALGTARLPKVHRDPFDRLLISQAIENSMILVTADENIARYPVKTLW